MWHSTGAYFSSSTTLDYRADNFSLPKFLISTHPCCLEYIIFTVWLHSNQIFYLLGCEAIPNVSNSLDSIFLDLSFQNLLA
jgi:hypothetical protein